MTYAEIYDRTEGVLLSMVREGVAELSGVGPGGPTFVAEADELWARMEGAGLLADDVPWPLSLRAVLQLRVEATTT